MGYYTDYTLDVYQSQGSFDRDELNRAVMEIDGGIFEEWGDLSWYAPEQTWYEQKHDMYELSLKFPNLLFCLHGRGEDEDDLWDEYWQDGSYEEQYSQIPPFDPSQMQKLYLDDDNVLTTVPPVEDDVNAISLPDM